MKKIIHKSLGTEIENLNGLQLVKKIESVIKTFLTEKSLGPYSFSGEVYRTFKEKKKKTMIFKFFQNIKDEGTSRNSFYEANITLVPKPNEDTTHQKKIQTNISYEF